MTAPTILGRAMRAFHGEERGWQLALPGAYLAVYRLHRWWRPWRGTLVRPEDIQHVRAWTPEWCADKLARRLARPGKPHRKDRSRARERVGTETAPGTPTPGGLTR